MTPPLSASVALSKVRGLVTDLLACIRDMGSIASTHDLVADLQNLMRYCEGIGVDVDLAVSRDFEESHARRLAPWLGADFEPSAAATIAQAQKGEMRLVGDDGTSVFRIVPITQPPMHKAGAPRPAVLVCATLGDESAEALTPEMEGLLEGRPFAVFCVEPLLKKSFRERLMQIAWVTDMRPMDNLPPGDLATRLNNGAADGLPLLLRSYSALSGVETAAEAVLLMSENEERALRVKRSAAQHRANKLQQPVSGPSEVIAEVQTRLQRTFGEFERGVRDRLHDLTAPPTGSLCSAADAVIDSVVSLQEEHRHKSVSVRLRADDERRLLTALRDCMRSHFSEDLRSLRDLNSIIAGEVEQILDAAGIPAPGIQQMYLADSRLTRLIDSVARLDRAFQGELPKPGIHEYFDQAKKYQALVAGLISAVGLSGLPRFRSVMIPLSAALLAVSLLSLPWIIRRERVEGRRRQVEAAKAQLRGEIKRISQEADRAWNAAIAEVSKETQASILAHVESTAREWHVRRSAEIGDERQRLQRQLQGLDTAERQLVAARRGRDLVVAGAGEIRGALRQLITGELQPMQRALT